MVPLRPVRPRRRRNPPARHLDPSWPPTGADSPWASEIDASYFDGWKEPVFSWEEQIRQKMERSYLPNWGKEQR